MERFPYGAIEPSGSITCNHLELFVVPFGLSLGGPYVGY